MTRARNSRIYSDRGTALLASLCFASVLTVALGSYITICLRTLEMSSRTLQGTQSVELAETGMEEALWALNKNDWSDWTISGNTATKSVSGFTFDGNSTGLVDLTVTNYNGVGGIRIITSSGTAVNPNSGSVTRTLTASSTKAPLFVNAIAATTGRVRFLNNGLVDSYDSRVGTYDGQTPTRSAVVSSGSTSTSSATVQMGGVDIMGYVATLGTGPSYTTSAFLLGPLSPDTTKIDTSRQSTSPYQPSFSEISPSGTSTLLPSGTTTIGSPDATTPAVYRATDIDLNGTQTLTVDGPVVLVVTGHLNISNFAQIKITATGSLEIHLAGDLAINGNGIQNDTLLPKNLAIIGTETETDKLGMATDEPFHGVVYVPKASLTISNSQAIYGAIVARSVTFSASPDFHYDVSLRNAVISGIATPYAVSDWRESTNGM